MSNNNTDSEFSNLDKQTFNLSDLQIEKIYELELGQELNKLTIFKKYLKTFFTNVYIVTFLIVFIAVTILIILLSGLYGISCGICAMIYVSYGSNKSIPYCGFALWIILNKFIFVVGILIILTIYIGFIIYKYCISLKNMRNIQSVTMTVPISNDEEINNSIESPENAYQINFNDNQSHNTNYIETSFSNFVNDNGYDLDNETKY